MSQNTKWVTAWANAMSIAEQRPAAYGKNITLRYPVKMPLNGEQIRITLDNFCGNEPAPIQKVSIALSDANGNIDCSTIQNLTFHNNPSVVIPAGETVKSDAIPYSVKKGSFLTVSMYFSEFISLRSGVVITGPLSKGWYAENDQTAYQSLDIDTSKKINTYYFLSDIEILTNNDAHTVICFGDSITAGAWPDYLIQRAESLNSNAAIVRKAACGTRILRQYDNITYNSYGLKATNRVPHEFPVTGADTMIVQHGINDIIHPVGVEVNPFRPWSDLPTSEEIIEGYRYYIREARKLGYKIYFGTLLPIEGWRTYADFREKLRNEVNDWIRNNTEADGCVDFAKAVCDQDNPSAFRKDYDSGDHLHPSASAYQRMAEEVPQELLK